VKDIFWKAALVVYQKVKLYEFYNSLSKSLAGRDFNLPF
jgi:hypothetical protein